MQVVRRLRKIPCERRGRTNERVILHRREYGYLRNQTRAARPKALKGTLWLAANVIVSFEGYSGGWSIDATILKFGSSYSEGQILA